MIAMELRHFRYFKAVAELQHFHNAAETLCISQPALSNQIKQLEAELGTNLFNRVGRRVELSEAGELVLSSIIPILNDVERMKDAVSEVRSGVAGALRVGVIQTVNALYIQELALSFAEICPNVSLHIEELSNDEIATRVANGELDIGIGFAHVKAYKSLEFTELFKEKWSFICAQEQASSAKSALSGAEHDLRAVLLPEYFETRRIINKYFLEHKISVNQVTEINSISQILNFVEKSCAFTILPSTFAGFAHSKQLQAFDLSYGIVPRAVGILTAENRATKKSVVLFSNILITQLSDL